MPHIEREIVINRPVEEVFDFVADGRNEPRYIHASYVSSSCRLDLSAAKRSSAVRAR